MIRDKQTHTLVKIRTVLVIILSALVTSMIIELIVAERTNALLQETVQGATSIVKQVVTPVLPSAPASPSTVSPLTQATSPNQKAVATPSTASTTSASSTPVAVTSTSSTMPLISTDLQKIYFKKAKMSESLSGARQADITNSVVSSFSFAWIQATEQGWKVAGIVWYWWVSGIVTVTAAVLVWRRNLKQFILNKLLSTQHILYAE